VYFEAIFHPGYFHSVNGNNWHQYYFVPSKQWSSFVGWVWPQTSPLVWSKLS
jgi:hypothetical protein